MSESSGETIPWLPAARAGSLDALGQALEKCRGYLLKIAEQEFDSALQPKAGASDLVQNTLLEAFRDFERFQGDKQDELRFWLRRLLLNNLADFTRQYHNTDKRKLDREISLEAGDASQERGAGLAGGVRSPSSDAVAREQGDAVRHALDRLPEDYRRVILLRYQDGQAFDEIGQALGLSPNAARKLLLRAVERVRQELGSTS